MKIYKFKAYSEALGISNPMTLQELVATQSDFNEFEEYIQYLGFQDRTDTEVYEGDVLELPITEELMSPNTGGFFNSNLGKTITQEQNITSVILEMRHNHPQLGTHYKVYFMRDGAIERDEDGLPECVAMSSDSNFPMYLCQYGATIIGNTISNKNILNELDNRTHTYNKIPQI